MKQLLLYRCLPRSQIGLIAAFKVRRSLLPHLGPAVVAYPSPFQVRVDGPGDVAGLSRYRVRFGMNLTAPPIPA